MRRPVACALRLGACCLIVGACARASTTGTAEPAPPAPPPGAPISSAPTPGAVTALPPVPFVDGPLEPRIVYPPANALIASRDSNFILGALGTGRAALQINGTSVPVHANGAFLAFLPNPPADAPRYELSAVAGADTVRLTHPIRLLSPLPVLADTGRLVVDSTSVQPASTMRLRPSDVVRVTVRAPRNATVSVAWAGGAQQLLGSEVASVPSTPGMPRLELAEPPPLLPVARDPFRWASDVPAALLARAPVNIVIARGADTVRLPIAAVELDSLNIPRPVMLGAPALLAGDLERAVVGRSVPDPAGASRWFLLPGTVTVMTGRVGGYTRIRFDSLLEIWVENADVTPLPPGTPIPRPTVLSARLAPARDWVDLVLPISDRIPFYVEASDRALILTLYGARASVDAIAYPENDSLIRTIEATQVASDRAQLKLSLDAQPFGWQTRWDEGRFILRVRRPPLIDRSSPLRALTIAVDPGHPPIGATGPTGLYEGDAVLEIGLRLKPMLEALGATVVMTRSTREAVPLADRAIIARRADAHAFVSIHLNAYPDGVNPFVANGTGTYFYFPQSERLARAVQRGMVARMGLRDIGVFQQSFNVIRNSWMPAVLCEGAFVIVPEQEAALRTAEFQDAYARGVVDGLEQFFAALASR